MKKLISMLYIIGFLTTTLSAQTSQEVIVTKTSLQDTQWEQSTDGQWVGRDNTLYKFDEHGNLIVSVDGINWEYSVEGWWEDRIGRWLTYRDNWLYMSDNLGVTWSNVSGNTWVGGDGVVYRFDEHGRLWKRQGVFDEDFSD